MWFFVGGYLRQPRLAKMTLVCPEDHGPFSTNGLMEVIRRRFPDSWPKNAPISVLALRLGVL
jgi:hypothetical protein